MNTYDFLEAGVVALQTELGKNLKRKKRGKGQTLFVLKKHAIGFEPKVSNNFEMDF